jgi:hypothetical protein
VLCEYSNLLPRPIGVSTSLGPRTFTTLPKGGLAELCDHVVSTDL